MVMLSCNEEISERGTLRCSKCFFAHSKVRSTAKSVWGRCFVPHLIIYDDINICVLEMTEAKNSKQYDLEDKLLDIWI